MEGSRKRYLIQRRIVKIFGLLSDAVLTRVLEIAFDAALAGALVAWSLSINK